MGQVAVGGGGLRLKCIRLCVRQVSLQGLVSRQPRNGKAQGYSVSVVRGSMRLPSSSLSRGVQWVNGSVEEREEEGMVEVDMPVKEGVRRPEDVLEFKTWRDVVFEPAAMTVLVEGGRLGIG